MIGYAPDPLAIAAERLLAPVRRWTPEPHQRPPAGDWDYWLLMAGRGAGKTHAGAHFVDEHMSGPACSPSIPGGHRAAVIAPTLDDARETCVRGVSGLLAANEAIRFNVNRGVVSWPNGAEARIFGAYQPDDPDRLRGPQHCLVWGEELAAWRQLDETFDMMRFGLRVGRHPRAVFTTTPKPRPRIKALLADPRTAVTRATTQDNPYLDPAVRAALFDRYAGTRLGRQELSAELLLDLPGAMWQAEWIERGRITPTDLPALVRVVVAVDPAVTAAEDADETAIAVAGIGEDGGYYVLAADGYHLSPHAWASRALAAYDARSADVIVAEVNNGGDMVISTIRAVRAEVNVRKISASRGKALRAEPIAALYEQGRVHHVGTFEVLEDQQTTFPVANEHDDRLDAVVYALTELTEGGSGFGSFYREEADRLRAAREVAA